MAGRMRGLAFAALPQGAALSLNSVYWSARSGRRSRLTHDGQVYQITDGVDVFFSPSRQELDPQAVWDLPKDVYLWGYVPQPDDLVVDLGAGIGTEATLYSRLVGARGCVIAVEAVPRVFECLQRAVEANGLGNVLAVQVAISDVVGSVALSDSAEGWLSNSGSATEGGSRAVRGLDLPTLLLECGQHDRRVALLKCNIEGAERPALVGAESVAHLIDRVVISCHDFRGQREGVVDFRTYTWVWAWLRDHGLHPQGRPDARAYVADTIYAARPSAVASA